MRPDSRLLRMWSFVLASTLLSISAVTEVYAAQILVGGGCGLREAVINANTNSKQGSNQCTRGSADEVDVILLPPETMGITATIEVTEDLVIIGGSGAWTILDARHRARILDVHPGVSLTIRGVQLLRGFDAEGGANIRVGEGGTLNAEYLVSTYGRVPATAADGRGAGILLERNASADIRRSEISANEVLSATGRGAGIFCAEGCDLKLSNSTVTGNTSGATGAGIEVLGQAALDYVTIGMNRSPETAGVSVSGRVSTFASIFADNGEGAPGADLDCRGTGAIQTAAHTFVESPLADCAVDHIAMGTPAGIRTRSHLPSALSSAVLNDIVRTSYESAPSRTHLVMGEYFPYLKGQIAYDGDASCRNLLDQHGRKRVPGHACDYGAFQSAALNIWKMGFSVYAHEPGKMVYVHIGDRPSVPTKVRVRPARRAADSAAAGTIGGIGENCADFETYVDFAVGQQLAELFVDPSQIFPLPGLNRPSRVCELEAEVVEGPASLLGATAGNVRVKVIGNPVSTARLSTPEPGYYLDFTTVPVGTGGLRSLILTPEYSVDSGITPFSVTRVTFRGNDKERFTVAGLAVTETSPGSGVFVLATPLPIEDRSNGGTALQIQCIPGRLGDADAEMIVSTDSPVYQDLVYGVRCSQAHYLSFTAIDSNFPEKDGPRIDITVSLDSPCLFDSDGFDGDDNDNECLAVDVEDIAGSATSGVDYEGFATRLIFAPGERQKVISFRVLDDSLVESAETIGVRVSPARAVSNLVQHGDRTAWLQIDDDDQPSREIRTFLFGLSEAGEMRPFPETAPPGETVPFMVAVHNRGTAALNGVRFELVVAQPMWIRSFALNGATCTVSSTNRRATCMISRQLAANLKPLTNPDGSDLSVEDDEANPARMEDADWIRVYGRIVTADMVRPPTLDIQGTISVSARAGDPVEEGATTRSLLIDAPSLNTTAGVLGLQALILLLLPFRWWRRKTAGRKIGWSKG